jgi:hypothetical protein
MPFTDGNLVNAWGITATSSAPGGVEQRHVSTIYRATARRAGPQSRSRAPTGIVAYSGTAFLLATSPNRPAQFIWASEDGDLAWNPLRCECRARREAERRRIYKGLAIHGDVLYDGLRRL